MAFNIGYDSSSASEFKLRDAPEDCIQSIKFGQVDSQHLLAASWDCTVRLYDIRANQLRAQYKHDAPVLDATFQGNNDCWSGGTDKRVKRYDFQSQTETTVGSHSDAIKCVDYNSETNLVCTGSWDRHLKLWDPRLSDSAQKSCIADHTMVDKIYTMTVFGTKLMMGLAGRSIVIMDLRNMTHVLRESLLKYQIRCIDTFPDQRGYATGSIEGRVAVEYLDASPEVQRQRYAFKCHRSKDSATGMELVYPVNAISFHRRYNTFATGGSDGLVSMWDAVKKKRIVQFHQYPTSISSLSFSPDGNSLAIACSHLLPTDDNLRDIPRDAIFVRRMSDQEVRQNAR